MFSISACYEGFYGPNCVHQCECVHAEACDKETGKCQCLPGYTGQLCDKGGHMFHIPLQSFANKSTMHK